MAFAEVDLDVNIQTEAAVDIDRFEAMASVEVDVDAYDVTDDDNLAVDAHVVDVASHLVNPDTLPFRRLLAYPIPPHDRGCVDAMNKIKFNKL